MNSSNLITSTGGFNAYLVSASVAIAIAGAYAALDLAARTRAGSRRRFTWISAAALVFGAGVWSMHFVGVLAYRSPVPITYDVTLTAISLVAVLVPSWGGFNLAAQRSTRWWTIPVAGCVTGAAGRNAADADLLGLALVREYLFSVSVFFKGSPQFLHVEPDRRADLGRVHRYRPDRGRTGKSPQKGPHAFRESGRLRGRPRGAVAQIGRRDPISRRARVIALTPVICSRKGILVMRTS